MQRRAYFGDLDDHTQKSLFTRWVDAGEFRSEIIESSTMNVVDELFIVRILLRDNLRKESMGTGREEVNSIRVRPIVDIKL